MAKEFKDVLNDSESFKSYTEKVRSYSAENGGDRVKAAKQAFSDMGIALSDDELASINGGSNTDPRTLSIDDLNKIAENTKAAKGFSLEFVFICSTH